MPEVWLTNTCGWAWVLKQWLMEPNSSQ